MVVWAGGRYNYPPPTAALREAIKRRPRPRGASHAVSDCHLGNCTANISHFSKSTRKSPKTTCLTKTT